jgi:hypothetical protein
MWEPLVCINPTAPDDQKRYLGGHCKVIINVCENCKDLHKCKKSGAAKDTCRQTEIDKMFRVFSQPESSPNQKPDTVAKPEPRANAYENRSGDSGQD